MRVTIKRQKDPESLPYWQSFQYDGPMDTTVAAVLDALNYTDDLFDETGKPAPRIRWECSCLQKLCGACAMVINGKPALACNTFLRELPGDELVLEPLTKFPVAADLIVDRSVIYDNLNRVEAYLDQARPPKKREYTQQYAVAKCLKCGLCLEVCPNYGRGEEFFGALFANESYLLHSQTETRKKELNKAYRKHFAAGCSKSLACQDVCPAEIPTLTSILRMNRAWD